MLFISVVACASLCVSIAGLAQDVHLMALMEPSQRGRLIEPLGKVLFEDKFRNLDNWHHEGTGRISVPQPGLLSMECVGSRQGDIGTQAICRLDFPDSVAIEFDLKVLTNFGLVITFVAMKGLEGQDILTGLPPRKGLFSEYTGDDADVRSYHVSISRYDDRGKHTGVSNWRRNPGLHLMSEGPDLCKRIKRWYRIRIVKNGRHCQVGVDGQLGHEFIDPADLTAALPADGKVGFRAIGANVHILIRNFRAVALH